MKKISLIVVAFIGTFLWMFSKDVITQDQSYHLFVDSRSLWGIPNFQNVVTNVFFLIAGFLGVRTVNQKVFSTRKAWFWFFVSIVLVAPGSAYYHWHPNDETLVWDRLPMSVGFMALYVVLLSEHVSIKFQNYLGLALFTGLFSIAVWVVTSDLRFYFWIQFSSFLTIPLILLLFRSRYTKKTWYLVTLLTYGLAKWVEVKDQLVFDLTQELISGHALKHILAALGLMTLWWMVKTRQEVLETAPARSVTDPASCP